MDDRGNWHDSKEEFEKLHKDTPPAERPTLVLSLKVGEEVTIITDKGLEIRAKFWEAKGKKMTFLTTVTKEHYAKRIPLADERKGDTPSQQT